ncbi:MAG: Gfo/Idh/MocA family oxidoreductase [Caldilineaceae bacterium]|nr:Gfo/Idh/MocA family oxidoreductase [Caldilineaceae bacterium]
MSNRKLRAAVIGGGLGGHHGYAYARAEEYELVAACDINPAAFDRFFERAQIERGSIREYTDYKEMFAKENLDVVSVATPDQFHVNPICDAAEAGIKGIFCEKPLCTTLADADRIVETIERTGAKLSIDHTRSYIPVYQAVKKAVWEDNEIGGLTRIIAHMGGRRSMLFRNGTHLVDAVCYLANAEPLWVIAAHERGFEDYGTVYKGEGGKDPMLDPGSTIIVEFANGVRGIINSAKQTPAIFEFDLQGPGGRYELKDSGCRVFKTKTPEGQPFEAEPRTERGYIDNFGDNLIPAVKEMAEQVWHDGPNSSPARRARNSLEIMVAALYSQARDSAKVHLPLPRDA